MNRQNLEEGIQRLIANSTYGVIPSAPHPGKTLILLDFQKKGRTTRIRQLPIVRPDDGLVEYDEYGYSLTNNNTDMQTVNEDNQSLKEKVVYKTLGKRGLFSKVGVEPTFYPSLKFPDVWLAGDSWADLFEGIAERFIYSWKNQIDHPWIRNKAYIDAGVLEVPSDQEYSTLEGIMKEYKSLLNIMDEYKFKPSTLIMAHSEGGCHVNFDLGDKVKEYGDKIVRVFCQNVIGFLNQHPGIAWSFLEANDNESSDLYTEMINAHDITYSTAKGYCLTVQENENNCDVNYMELRFFMMPRCIDEFKFHIQFGSALLKYIWNETIKKPEDITFNMINDSDTLKRLKLKNVIEDLKQVYKKIGINWNLVERFGKVKMLTKRYRIGKSQLQ